MFTSDELNILCAATESYRQSYHEELNSLIEIASKQAKTEGVAVIKSASVISFKKIDDLLIKLRKLQIQAVGL